MNVFKVIYSLHSKLSVSGGTKKNAKIPSKQCLQDDATIAIMLSELWLFEKISVELVFPENTAFFVESANFIPAQRFPCSYKF